MFMFQGGSKGSPHMSRKVMDGPAGMIGGAHLPSAALLHEAKLGELFYNFQLYRHNAFRTTFLHLSAPTAS